MIIAVNKPCGWTSNDVVQKLKHGCGFKKVGHAGTLDPLAEGVLLMLTDWDTKRQSEFMGLEKEYLVKIAFGYESDSHDFGTPLRPAGKIIADKLTVKALQAVLTNYLGLIQQQVPAYSAVHVDGQRLYKVARNNIEAVTTLPYKEIEVYDINICSFINNESINYSTDSLAAQISCPTAEMKIRCGKGTYIRSMVRDIGKDLGCGSVAVSLVRTRVGSYKLDSCLTIDQVLLEHLKL
jgi:tRNA pseudouridine55 synthase